MSLNVLRLVDGLLIFLENFHPLHLLSVMLNLTLVYGVVALCLRVEHSSLRSIERLAEGEERCECLICLTSFSHPLNYPYHTKLILSLLSTTNIFALNLYQSMRVP